MPTFENKKLQRNQGHHAKALETRIPTRQTRGLAKIRVVRKSTIAEATQLLKYFLGKKIDKHATARPHELEWKIWGDRSQQFRKVLTQSALSFSTQDPGGLLSYLHSHSQSGGSQWWKNQSPWHEKQRALHLSACRLVESIVFTLVNCGPNVGSTVYHLGSLSPA